MNRDRAMAACRTAGPAVLFLAAAGAAGWLVGGLWPGGTGMPARADDGSGPWPPTISVNKLLEGENEVGELLIDDELVIQLRARTDELTPYERVVIVAERLKAEIRPRNRMAISTGFRDGQHVVLANDAVILTPLPDDLPAGMTMREGAQVWAEALATAFGIETTAALDPLPWDPDVPYEDRIVPIVSLGKGKRIGAARVNGPTTAVDQVKAVAQLEAHMLKWFNVQVYVPISTEVPGKTIDRVQGVAVTAVGDFRL